MATFIFSPCEYSPQRAGWRRVGEPQLVDQRASMRRSRCPRRPGPWRRGRDVSAASSGAGARPARASESTPSRCRTAAALRRRRRGWRRSVARPASGAIECGDRRAVRVGLLPAPLGPRRLLQIRRRLARRTMARRHGAATLPGAAETFRPVLDDDHGARAAARSPGPQRGCRLLSSSSCRHVRFVAAAPRSRRRRRSTPRDEPAARVADNDAVPCSRARRRVCRLGSAQARRRRRWPAA